MSKRRVRCVGLSLLVVMFVVLFSGCYINEKIEASTVGVRLNRGAIEQVVGPGIYSGGIFKDIKKVNISALTSLWSDPDTWTSDKQSVNFSVSVTYARKADDDSVKGMWSKYNAQASNNEELEKLVLTRIPRVVKQVSTGMSLDQMLGIADNDTTAAGREVLQQRMFDLLKAELDECYIELLDIGVNDIGVDPTYAEALKNKARATVELELAQAKAKQLAEQVNQERAQTDVDLEIARRENLVKAEQNKVYVESSEAYALRKLELLKDILGDKDKIYFIPQGADLTLYLAGETGGAMPPIIGGN